MKLLITKIALLTGCLTMSACVFSDSAEKPGALTKEDAKKIVNPGEDLCDIYNWYGDGECDAFCENADPDCNIQCDAIPVCAAGFYEVEVCHSGSQCLDVTMCGTTIKCQEEEIYCLAGLSQPFFECPEGFEIVDECDPDGGECYISEGYCGGQGIICQESMIQCDAYPTCEENMIPVASCDDAQDMPCVEETLCGNTIGCVPIGICDGLFCVDGYYDIESCPTDSDCYSETACGMTISCMKTTVNCLAYPSCPENTKEVQACDPNTTCSTATMCGVTIMCQGI